MRSKTREVLSSFVVLAALAANLTSAIADKPAGPRSARRPDEHPLSIVENAGQFDPKVRFQASADGMTLWVTPDTLWITWLNRPSPNASMAWTEGINGSARATPAGHVEGFNLEMTFLGARSGVSPQPSLPLATRMSYLVGADPKQWHPNVRAWGMVTWRNLYPGVSLSLARVGGVPALVIDASAGANLGALKLRVVGVKGLRALTDGQVVAETSGGTIALPALVQGGRTLRPRVVGSRISVDEADGSRPLSLEPSTVDEPTTGNGLLYGTYLGGSDQDQVTDVAVGPDGSTYVAGWTFSLDFPTTPGAFDTTNDNGDAFVSKLDPTGSSLIYSTFIGGGSVDYGHSLAIGPNGETYLGGVTESSDYPTIVGGFDTNFGGPSDGFITEIDPAGDALVYSTFLGGSNSGDSVETLALAPGGTVYATGETLSADFPTTPGAFETMINGNGISGYIDAFVTALNPAGTDLTYSTFLGGTYNDIGYGIAIGPEGTAYVTGDTSSYDFPTSPGAYDPTANGGLDVFVTRVSTDGTALVFSTYMGGGDDDSGQGIALDSTGDVCITGSADSPDYPTTPGAYDTTQNSPLLGDVFVTKLDPTGSALVYSTFLGGSGVDSGSDLIADPDGSVTVTGWTLSPDFPTTPEGYDRTLGGSGDAVVSRFDPTGSTLAYSSFLGGSSTATEFGFAITPARRGAVTVAGTTSSSDFPTVPRAYDRTYNGSVDGFVATVRVAPTMHVASIDPTYRPDGLGYDVGARIRIVSANGSPVSGAVVRIELDYPNGSNLKLSATTGAKGRAVVVHYVTGTGTYTFTVLNALKPPMVYDPSQNVETSDSVTIP